MINSIFTQGGWSLDALSVGMLVVFCNNVIEYKNTLMVLVKGKLFYTQHGQFEGLIPLIHTTLRIQTCSFSGLIIFSLMCLKMLLFSSNADSVSFLKNSSHDSLNS